MEDDVSATTGSDTADADNKKTAGTVKPKKPLDHPKYQQMIVEAIHALRERSGSSRQAIMRYMLNKYSLGPDESNVSDHLKLALRAGVKQGVLKQTGGMGASGYFSVGEKKKKNVSH